jgi:hypothetical protein
MLTYIAFVGINERLVYARAWTTLRSAMKLVEETAATAQFCNVLLHST